MAQIVGVHRTRVSNWTRAKEAGGTGGMIPFKHVPAILAEAKDRGLELSADDFLPRVPAEVLEANARRAIPELVKVYGGRALGRAAAPV